jgi:hypothetical protein
MYKTRSITAVVCLTLSNLAYASGWEVMPVQTQPVIVIPSYGDHYSWDVAPATVIPSIMEEHQPVAPVFVPPQVRQPAPVPAFVAPAPAPKPVSVKPRPVVVERIQLDVKKPKLTKEQNENPLTHKLNNHCVSEADSHLPENKDKCVEYDLE